MTALGAGPRAAPRAGQGRGAPRAPPGTASPPRRNAGLRGEAAAEGALPAPCP